MLCYFLLSCLWGISVVKHERESNRPSLLHRTPQHHSITNFSTPPSTRTHSYMPSRSNTHSRTRLTLSTNSRTILKLTPIYTDSASATLMTLTTARHLQFKALVPPVDLRFNQQADNAPLYQMAYLQNRPIGGRIYNVQTRDTPRPIRHYGHRQHDSGHETRRHHSQQPI